MTRITIKFLNAQCTRLNRLTGSPLEAYTKSQEGTFKANVGCFHISQAYGGYCLHRMHNECGGASSPLNTGHIPARDLSNLIGAYIAGIESTK